MSDLSRLRAKWERLEIRLGKLNRELLDIQMRPTAGERTAELQAMRDAVQVRAKIADAEGTLAYVKRRVAWEEKRLLEPDTLLRFTGQ